MEATKITTTEARSDSYGARNIFRRSIYTFLQNYHYFTSNAAFMALPFSASVLLSQSSSSVLPSIHGRLEALFVGARFPSSGLLSILILKLSQTISSSVLTIPFSLTFLLLAKASVLNTLQANDDLKGKAKAKAKTLGLSSIYCPLLHTSLWNTLVIISANATTFCILFLVLSLFHGLNTHLVLVLGAALYSIILANALIISSLALVVSGVEGRGGYMAILKACVLIRGRTSTALTLAVPISLAMAGIEALFQFRAHHHHRQQPALFLAIEPLFIAYMHSIVALLGTVVSYMFLKTCNKAMDQEMGGGDQQRFDSINV